MYLEEFKVGQKIQLEPFTLSSEEINEFALKYDPQPLHMDIEFAEDSIYKGIIASGYHTLCAMWSQWIKLDMQGREIIGGMGIDFLTWVAPVYPDDQLTTEVEVVDTIKTSKKGRGILVLKFVLSNAQQQNVMITQVRAMLKSRG